MGRLIDLADDIVSFLNGQSLSQGFVAERKFVPSTNPHDLSILRVYVLVKSVDRQHVSRGSQVDEVEIYVAIGKKLEVGSQDADASGLLTLTEEIIDALQGESMGDARFLRSSYEQIYGATLLDTKSIYMGVITLTYRIPV